ncbi:hypothetical protein [Bartonella sp. LJL80]
MSTTQNPPSTSTTVTDSMERFLKIGAARFDCDDLVFWMERIMRSDNDLKIDDPLVFDFMTQFSVAMCNNARQRRASQDDVYIHFAQWLRKLKPLYNRRSQISLEQLAEDVFYDYTG